MHDLVVVVPQSIVFIVFEVQTVQEETFIRAGGLQREPHLDVSDVFVFPQDCIFEGVLVAEGKGVHIFLYRVVVGLQGCDLLVQLLNDHAILANLLLHLPVLQLCLPLVLLHPSYAHTQLLVLSFDPSVDKGVVPHFVDLQLLENLLLLGLVSVELLLNPPLLLAGLSHEVGQLLTLFGDCLQLLPQRVIFLLQFLNCVQDILDFYVVLQVALDLFDLPHQIALDLNTHLDDSTDELPLLFALEEQKQHHFDYFLHRFLLHHTLPVAPGQSFALDFQEIGLQGLQVGSKLEDEVVEGAKVVLVDGEQEVVEEGS